jgi:hypothetical protein
MMDGFEKVLFAYAVLAVLVGFGLGWLIFG